MKEGVSFFSAKGTYQVFYNLMIGTFFVFMFLLSIQLMGASFRVIGAGFTSTIFDLTSNPFIGLFIGLLITAILQSSSTTTSMAVAAVASSSLTLQQAIPIILGANIGTTLTSTIVSLSYINKTAEFKKAISAGTVHDIYNIIIVLLVLPLELNYQMLSNLSAQITEFLPLIADNNKEIVGIQKIFGPFQHYSILWFGEYLTLLISFVLLFGTVKLISTFLYNKWIGTTKETIENTFFNHKYKTFGWGLIITSVVQSSSLTTSLVVPLVATGKVKLNRAFQFILGANLGTTITAILAALFKSEAAMSLAIAHFVFNLFGVIIFLNLPFMERIPVFLADKLGAITLKNRFIGFLYIILTFFLIPFSLIYYSTQGERHAFQQSKQAVELVEKQKANVNLPE